MSDLAVLHDDVEDLVSEVEDVPPVEVRHVLVSLSGIASVEEVQDVFGGEFCLFQTSIQKIHHCGVSECVLQREPWSVGWIISQWNCICLIPDFTVVYIILLPNITLTATRWRQCYQFIISQNQVDWPSMSSIHTRN